MLAVSRTVSPCAIWLFSSSSSDSVNPRALAAAAKEKRVRVELSRKIEMASPESKARYETPSWWRSLSASASVRMALISSVECSHVRRCGRGRSSGRETRRSACRRRTSGLLKDVRWI
jgi:hypothetical protein